MIPIVDAIIATKEMPCIVLAADNHVEFSLKVHGIVFVRLRLWRKPIGVTQTQQHLTRSYQLEGFLIQTRWLLHFRIAFEGRTSQCHRQRHG